MVPKLHDKGSSFKGAALYLLHDKGRAQSNERVAWTETRNVAVEDPEIAWRIMAATAMDQARLKEQAGVKNTGRKSSKHVLHFTLSWHPEQDPSQKEMSEAADEAIAAIGGSKHQAMLIAHDDEKHPHIHIMLNRVSPIDGRHLSSSKEKLKLSEWAQDYEERTGIYCENRIINNAMRKDGDYVRGKKDKARHIFETQREASSNDNSKAAAIEEEQRKRDAVLAKRGRNLVELQKRAWEKLQEAHTTRKDALARDLERKTTKAKEETREAYRPRWQALNRHQRSEQKTFKELEKSFFGRTSNMAKTMTLAKDDIAGDKRKIISRAFQLMTNEAARKEVFLNAQRRVRASLKRDQQQEAQRAAKELKTSQELKFAQNRAVYQEQRLQLTKTQEAERAALQQDWQRRSAERKAQYAELAKQPAPDPSKRETQYVSFDELMKLRALEQRRKAVQEGTGQDNTPPAPDTSGRPRHKVDFDKLRKDVDDIKRDRSQDKSRSQSDDDMDI